MKITGPITNVYVPARPLYHRRVEKLRAINDLSEKPGKITPTAILNRAVPERSQSSRFETGYRGRAFETGISAGFVAHLLGQISETNRVDAQSVARAYTATENVEEPRLLRSI